MSHLPAKRGAAGAARRVETCAANRSTLSSPGDATNELSLSTVALVQAATDAPSQAERLLELSSLLSSAVTLPHVSDAVMAATRLSFPDSAGAIIVRYGASETNLEIFAVSDLPGQVFENWRSFPVDSDAPLAECVRTGDVIRLNSPADWECRYPHLTPLLVETGHQAQLVAPLVAGGKVIGALGVAFRSPRTFSDEETQLLVAVSGQCAIALERARLYTGEMEARQAAEKANRAKSDFLANLSHELRTPLNAIGGYAELIELGVHGPVSEEQAAALARIQASKKHIQGLINSVLEFSRLEAGVTHYALQPVKLDDVIAACESLTAPQMQHKRLQYNRGRSDLSLAVHADEEKLRQILVNLLTNALKYTESGGEITVDVESDDQNVRINVRDTGRGIDPTDLETAFQPFIRLHSTGGVAEGVGLGLPISRSLARGMGGDLRASSSPGRGSTFTISLPRAPTFDVQ